MKEYYIKDILENNINVEKKYELYGWLRSLQKHKSVYFLEIEDSSGCIKAEINRNLTGFEIKKEQSIFCRGTLSIDKNGNPMMVLDKIELIGDVKVNLFPAARANFNVFLPQNAHNVVTNKHLYIRNSKNRDILIARNLVIEGVRKWFRNNGYYDVTAPILTPVLLYDESTGIDVHIKGKDAFLTQCVGFYLESAVHSLEKVFNIGPSFRAAESVSKRHLMEYWHVKSELAFCCFEEYFDIVESMICFVTKYVKENGGKELAKRMNTDFCEDGLKVPFVRIEYTEAIKILNDNGIKLAFGKSLNDKAEDFLAKYLKGPFWIVHKPKEIEGFPYKYTDFDPQLTQTADLISSRGMGEILGIADKITDIDMLLERLEEKGKKYEDYKWFCDLREYGTVPHCGLGMGLERLIRWLFCMPHVKDVIPFPRRINKSIYP